MADTMTSIYVFNMLYFSINSKNYAHFYLLAILLFNTSHRDPVIHTEEYAPQITPAMSGAANSRMEDTPKIYNTATIIKVVMEV